MSTSLAENDAEALPTVIYEAHDRVAHITLNRPEVLNAINPTLMVELDQALDRAAGDQSVKAVVIRGAGGRALSAGADLKHFQQKGVLHDVGDHLRFTAQLRDLYIKVEQLPLPVIAVIDGYALAGGLELALACDLILCTDDAQIGDQHANYGLIAGAGGTQRLPRRIGNQKALELLFTGRRLNGQEAVAYGLALRSASRDRIDATLEELLALLRTKSRVGLGLMKSTVKRGRELPLREALDIERLVVQEYFSCHADAIRGVADFNAKKKSSDH